MLKWTFCLQILIVAFNVFFATTDLLDQIKSLYVNMGSPLLWIDKLKQLYEVICFKIDKIYVNIGLFQICFFIMKTILC